MSDVLRVLAIGLFFLVMSLVGGFAGAYINISKVESRLAKIEYQIVTSNTMCFASFDRIMKSHPEPIRKHRTPKKLSIW